MGVSVCVFCASSDHIPGIYNSAARELGVRMASLGMTLVYGGGNNGLMGVLSEAVFRSGGRIVGVIPRRLKELGFAYENVDEMIVTGDMRERKTVMEERSDGFIGLPGGFGTLEEMLEVVALKQLKVHDKPVVFLNIHGFFEGLLLQFERGYSEHFVEEKHRELYHVAGSIDEALEYIERETG